MSDIYFSFSGPLLTLFLDLSERLGEVNGMHFASLPIRQENNYRLASNKACLDLIAVSLSLDKVEKLSNRYLIKAPKKDIRAAQQLISNYDQLENFSYSSFRDFNTLHKNLASAFLLEKELNPLTDSVKALFKPLKDPQVPELVKAIQFHYFLLCSLTKNKAAIELALYWQKLILISYHNVFRFLDYESFLVKRSKEYERFARNAKKDKDANRFYRFMLSILNEAVEDYLMKQKLSVSTEDRIKLFCDTFKGEDFTRQDYLRKFKFISAITASRDLRYAVEAGLFVKKGDKRMARYWMAKKEVEKDPSSA